MCVATDGKRLVAIESIAEQPDQADVDAVSNAPVRFTLQQEWARAIVALSKACGGKLKAWITFDWCPGRKRMDVEFVGCDMTLNCDTASCHIEQDFPNWRQIVPPKAAKVPHVTDLGINAQLMADFAKASKLLGAETPIIQMQLVSKDGIISVAMARLPNFFGLIMPCKADESIDYQPEFATITEMFKQAPPTTNGDEE